MSRFWMRPTTLAALALSLAVAGSRARADIELQINVNGDTSSHATFYNSGPSSGTSATFSGSVSDSQGDTFGILISVATTNSPGSPGGATLQLSNINITAGSNNAVGAVLNIGASANGYTAPNGGPLVVASTFSGSVNQGGLLSGATFNAYANANNTLFSTAGATSSDLSVGAVSGNNSFAASGETGGFTPNGSAYSMTINSSYTLTAGSTLTGTSGNAGVVTPEPATMASGLVGLGLIGGLGWLRRRNCRD